MRRLLLFALLLSLPAAALAKKPGIAVMDIRNVQGVQAGTATLITDMIVTEVSNTRRFDVVGSSDIASLLGLEKQKQLLQCGEDSSCLAELGGALGVDYLLSGTVGLLGTRLRISLTIQNVKKARVVARQAKFCDPNEDALARATEETIRALLYELDVSATVAKQGEPPPPLPPPPPTTRPPPVTTRPPPNLTPAPPPPVAYAPSTGPTPGPARPTGSRLSRRSLAYIAGGAGLALVAAGGAFDYMAYSAYQDQKDAAAARDRAAYDSALSTGKSRAMVANVLYGVGLASAGVGAYLYFTGPSSTATQLSVVPTDGGAVLSLGGVLP